MRLLLAITFLATAAAHAATRIPIVKQEIPIGHGHTKIAYGIYVKVGAGGKSRLYQLDTGNASFLAGHARDAPPENQIWGASTPLGDEHFTTGFGSGITMQYKKVTAQVTLSDPSGSDLAVIPAMTVGQVGSAHGDDLPGPTYWHDRIAADQPGLHQTYYGNFGAALYCAAAESAQPLFSALGQVENLTGFILSLAGPDPALILIFNTPEDQAYIANTFPNATPALPGLGHTFPVTGYPTHPEFPFAFAGSTVDGISTGAGRGLFDTGGTSLQLPPDAIPALEGSSLLDRGIVAPGHPFLMQLRGAGTVGGQTFPDFQAGFTSGAREAFDRIATGRGFNPARLNLGPSIYNFYDIYFDLQYGTFRFSSRN